MTKQKIVILLFGLMGWGWVGALGEPNQHIVLHAKAEGLELP
jgi:hypothetical protein